MRRFTLVAALAAVASITFLSLSQGQGDDKKKEKDTKEGEVNRKISKEARTVEQVAAAYKMADFGRENKVPEALIAAARVIGTANCKKGELEPKSKVGKTGAGTEKKEALALLDEAVKMAKDSEAIKALAEQARKAITTKAVGAVGGPRVWYGLFLGLESDRLDTYYVTCYGGEMTYVSLHGYNASALGLDLDLEVYDTVTGKLVARDASVGPDAFVGFYVPTRRQYRIHVINYIPRIACDYVLRTN